MPLRKLNPPAVHKAERDLNEAIDRLLANAPRNKDLARALREKNFITINKLNVAKEAERSRTTLDKYPAVVARIEALSRPAATSTRDALDRLRGEKHQIDHERRLAIDVAVAMLARMRKLEENAARAVAEARRVAKRPDPNKVVGIGNVVSYKRDSDDAG